MQDVFQTYGEQIGGSPNADGYCDAETGVVEQKVSEETPVTTDAKPEVVGVVTNCLKLNIRKAPSRDAEVVAIIPALTEVLIDGEEANDIFYKVSTSDGIQGFCMKEFVAVRQ